MKIQFEQNVTLLNGCLESCLIILLNNLKERNFFLERSANYLEVLNFFIYLAHDLFFWLIPLLMALTSDESESLIQKQIFMLKTEAIVLT